MSRRWFIELWHDSFIIGWLLRFFTGGFPVVCRPCLLDILQRTDYQHSVCRPHCTLIFLMWCFDRPSCACSPYSRSSWNNLVGVLSSCFLPRSEGIKVDPSLRNIGHESEDKGLTVVPVKFTSDFFFNFKVFYWICYNTSSVIYALVFWLRGMWDLSSPTRDWTHTPCTRRWIFNH